MICVTGAKVYGHNVKNKWIMEHVSVHHCFSLYKYILQWTILHAIDYIIGAKEL